MALTNDQKYVIISRVGAARAALYGAYDGNGGSGTGAVSSVNGKIGDVVLVAADVNAATAAQGAKADTATQPADLASGLSVKANQTDLNTTNTNIAANTAALASKVDIVAGKQLSTNDYTTADFTKLSNLPAFNRLWSRDIGGFGDSFTANCHSIAATAYSTENYGYLGNTAAFSGTAFANYTNNFGVVGENTAAFIARIAAPLASTCNVFLFPSVTNDRTTTSPQQMTLADTKRNVLYILEQFTNAGKLLIVGTGTPRFSAKALTTAQAQDAYDYRTWVLNELSKLTPVVNIWDDYLEADTVDGLHPNPSGAVKLASKFVAVINQLKMKPIPIAIDAADTYSTLSPKGSTTPNVFMATTAATGTIQTSANPVAGSIVADGWTVLGSSSTALAGVSVKASVASAPNPGLGNAQAMQLSGAMTTAGGYLSFQPLANFTLTNYAVGDVIAFMCGYQVVGTQKGLLSCELELIVVKPVSGTSTTIYYRGMDKYQTGFPMNANISGVLESQHYTFDGTETSIRVRVASYLETSVTQDQTVYIYQPTTRKL